MTNEEKLYALLDELSIEYTVHEHKPAFTVEQSLELASFVPGTHCKNLFLKDDKKQFWLFVARHDAVIALKKVGKTIGAPGLRFAQPDLLEQHLGVQPGSVTPLALINDFEHAVHVILDDSLLAADLVGFHPLRNSATIVMSPQDLLRFLKHHDNSLTVYTL